MDATDVQPCGLLRVEVVLSNKSRAAASLETLQRPNLVPP